MVLIGTIPPRLWSDSSTIILFNFPPSGPLSQQSAFELLCMGGSSSAEDDNWEDDGEDHEEN